MKFSFGGSAKKWWQGFEEGLRGGAGRSGGELGKLTSNLKQGSEYLQKQGGGTIGEQLLHRPGATSRLSKGLATLDRNTMGWSRQASPLWEGGLTGIGGSSEELVKWGQGLNRKLGAIIHGDEIWARNSPGGGSGTTVASSESEDPSLINQGKWIRPGTMESIERRLERENRGGLSTDLVKTKRGRLKAANLS